MAGQHRSSHDPDTKRFQREVRKLHRAKVKRERAARDPEPANQQLIKFSIIGLVLSAIMCGFLVWIKNQDLMWAVGLAALIHWVNLLREIRAHLRYRAVSAPANI